MRRRLIFAFALLALFTAVAFVSASFFLPASETRSRKIVEVPPGATLRQIAGRLQEKGVIRNRYAFILMARILGQSSSLKTGEYELRPDMTLIEILDKLQRGDATTLSFTIPEGYTIEQVAETLGRERVVDERRFLRLVKGDGSGEFRSEMKVPRSTLEGYLFPETYTLKKGATEKAVVAAMLAAFRSRVVESLADDLARSGLTLDQAVIMASLIEREARSPGDRPLISAVIHNRLKRGMLLQIDATVLYAMGRHKERVLLSDLETPSPYNTYRRAGLPPGPICSPGLSAIEATLRPAKVNYLYYVAKPDGSHIFSVTYAQHQQAIRRARAMQRASSPAG